MCSPPVVGMVGAGQLARMTHQAAISLGQSLRVLAISVQEPAAQVVHDVVLGEPTDPVALADFVRGCAAITFDHENVPGEHLRALEASGVPLRPSRAALVHAQDKVVMRERLVAMGVTVPTFRTVREPGDVAAFGAEYGWPVVLKAARGGYDGRGVWVLDDAASAHRAVESAGRNHPGVRLLVEQHVAMRREIAALVARSPFGQAAAWPVVQTVQADGICVQVLAPAPGLPEATASAAQRLALRIAAELDVVGLLAVELFEVPAGGADDPTPAGGAGERAPAGGAGERAPAGELVVNELAMRPHNSGHWTIEGSRTSQFEQHLRAVLDYPLGNTGCTAPAVAMSNVLGAAHGPRMVLDERLHHLLARFPDVKVHLYGKVERPGRKIGHVTALGAAMPEVARRAELAARWLAAGEWADGWPKPG